MRIRTKYFTLDFLTVLKIIIPIFFSTGIFLWLYFDSSVPYWDEAYHLNKSYALSQLLKNISSIPQDPVSIYIQLMGYPPLYHLLTVPFIWILPKLWFIRLVNIIYLCILSFVILKLGNRIPNRYAGIIALFVILSMPELSLRQRVFYIDAAICSLCLLSLYLLFKADDFIDRKNAALFGISLGFGLMTKWTFFFFLAFPTFYKFVEIFKKRDYLLKQRFLNFIFSLGIAFLIVFPWYFVFRRSIYKLLLVNTGTGFYAQGEHLYDFASLSYYFKVISDNLTWPILLATIFGIFIVVKTKKHPFKKILYFYILPGLLALILIENKQGRFCLPILSVLPLFGVISIYYIKKVKIRNVLITLFLLSSFLGYITSTFFSSSFMNRILFPTNCTKQFFILQPKTGERESILALFKEIDNDSNYRNSKLLVAADSPPVEFNALMNVKLMNHISHITLRYASWRRREPYDELITEINNVDYIMTVSPSTGPEFAAKYINQIIEYLSNFIETKKIIKIGDFPIGNKMIHLYRVNHNPDYKNHNQK